MSNNPADILLKALQDQGVEVDEASFDKARDFLNKNTFIKVPWVPDDPDEVVYDYGVGHYISYDTKLSIGPQDDKIRPLSEVESGAGILVQAIKAFLMNLKGRQTDDALGSILSESLKIWEEPRNGG